jgi:D-inositol-3-phosphate glycosyltransferase
MRRRSPVLRESAGWEIVESRLRTECCMPETRVADALPRRVAMISLHTSPLAQAGAGDAGGMNVYVDAVARELTARDIAVDVYTKGDADTPATVAAANGYRVHHILHRAPADLAKDDLPRQLDAAAAEILGHAAAQRAGGYDLIHSHYWLSGQVGRAVAGSWDVPLVHSMHTLARVKNAARALGERPEPSARIRGEDRIVAAADLLIANTPAEEQQLRHWYRAPGDRLQVVHPGVDLAAFRPGDRLAVRRRLGLPEDRAVLLFVGRLQPLKAPDLAIRALAAMVAEDPRMTEEVLLVVCGGPSGNRPLPPQQLARLADELGVGPQVRLVPPVSREDLADWYRAANLTVVPSHSESFGLVAVESQAVGTPVVAAAVGGLRTAVVDGSSGVLVAGHDPADWARVLTDLVRNPDRRHRLATGALRHAQSFSWQRTADQLLAGYAGVLAPAPMAAVAG